ncbi:MAG: universal stress protein [Pseudomonadota bacterium]
MPLKNILLHMANDDHHSERLKVAIRLAQHYDGHIHICYFTQPQSMPAAVTGRGASYVYLQEATAIAHEKAEQLNEEIERECHNLSWSFETLEEDHVDAMARRSTLADLAIVSQSHQALKTDRVCLHLPDRLTLVASCPTLVLPVETSTDFTGKHLMLSWKAKREASRALRDSLGLMRDAEQVSIAMLYRRDTEKDVMAESKRAKQFLSNHDIDAEIHLVPAHRTRGNGSPLLNLAEQIKVDGIIMGAYSHSRFREQILGGMTYYMLHHTDIPLIMSH